MPKISIILPCYNVEKYIAKSIESVLSQTYQNYELLIINDGTPDNSMAVAKTFDDPRIKIFNKPNGGLSDARNYGLERAQGKYIYFMDSDDWIEPNLLEDNLKIIEEERLDFVVFGYIQDDENKEGELVHSKIVLPDNITYYKENHNLKIEGNLLGLLGYAWNKIYRKSFLNKHQVRFEKGTSMIEDILFNSQVYIHSDRIRLVDKAYYHYGNRPEVSLMKQFHHNSFDLKLRRKNTLKDFFNEWQVNEGTKKKVFSGVIVGGIRYCVDNLFAYKNDLKLKDKVAYIKMMLNHPETVESVVNFNPVSRNDKIFKYLIENKMHRSMAAMALIIK